MSISQLDPFIDESNVIHVGGRLQSSHISDNSKHPILLPRKEKVSDLIIKLCHSNVAHGGCGFTLNEIQGAGYWIVGANSAIKAISNCVECQRFRGRVGEQKMANLPACRLKEAAPFTHCGVDMFGPFTVKQRRSTVKRYGAMFTCMASRAVHIEVTFFPRYRFPYSSSSKVGCMARKYQISHIHHIFLHIKLAIFLKTNLLLLHHTNSSTVLKYN